MVDLFLLHVSFHNIDNKDKLSSKEMEEWRNDVKTKLDRAIEIPTKIKQNIKDRHE